MRARLAVAALVNSVLINIGKQIWQQGSAEKKKKPWACFLPIAIHSELLPRSRSIARKTVFL